MYVTNRKHAYKVVKQFKNGKVLISNVYGAVLKYHKDYLIDQGYKFVSRKPAAFSYREGVTV